jgi:CAAX prenyl protease-like protein
LGFTLPYLIFVAAMAVDRFSAIPPAAFYAIRLTLVTGALVMFSRPYLELRPRFAVWSIVLGVLVFIIWIGPDLLFDYRHSVIFENALTGKAVSSVPQALRRNVAFVMLRTISCTLAVPVLEELFWRGWLMRWLVRKDFLNVPYGKYVPSVFWIVAILFASEHGPYWEVGLAAGILYNWWMIRTKSLADCILAHAVTNGCLSFYVLATGLWRYWL